jgi:hypothetical protein
LLSSFTCRCPTCLCRCIASVRIRLDGKAHPGMSITSESMHRDRINTVRARTSAQARRLWTRESYWYFFLSRYTQLITASIVFFEKLARCLRPHATRDAVNALHKDFTLAIKVVMLTNPTLCFRAMKRQEVCSKRIGVGPNESNHEELDDSSRKARVRMSKAVHVPSIE